MLFWTGFGTQAIVCPPKYQLKFTKYCVACFILYVFYWSIIDLNVVLISVPESDSDIHMLYVCYICSFSYSFALWSITAYWIHWNGKRQAGNQKYETRALSQLFLVFCRFTCPLQNHFSYKSQKFSQLQRISFGEDICLPYPFYSPGGDNLRIRARTKFKLIWKNRCNWETNDKLGDTNHFLHQYIWDIWNHSR